MPSYPLSIRTILKAGKSRTQPPAFSMSEPRRGYAYAQSTGTDVPVFWDVSFLFSRDEAVSFQLWFRRTLNYGVNEFTMPIKTEFGTVEHTCRFLPDSLLPTSEVGPFFAYSATIMARKLVIPATYDEAADLIVGLPNWSHWTELLDEAMTAEMPGA